MTTLSSVSKPSAHTRGLSSRRNAQLSDLDTPLCDFLALPYAELQRMNLAFKALTDAAQAQKKVLEYLGSESRIKAVTLAFADMEGKLQMLDYDKTFFLDAYENLTFDGSSVRGFTELSQSDLRLQADWCSFRILPSDVFGAGKVLMFGFVCNHDGRFFAGDFRSRLHSLMQQLQAVNQMVLASPEIEGFLLQGEDAEQHYREESGFELVTQGGYFNALSRDKLRQFIDKVAEVQRALGFENEKDHGEVAPSQFEINFKYTPAVTCCDQILLYKLVARQVAKLMGCTASFLPKPFMGLNGSGMHTNMSLSEAGKNIFFDHNTEDHMSETAHRFITGILSAAPDLCLTICSSVNAYRRLDPNFEAPNEIKYSACDRGSMVRLPLGNAKSARIEVRSVAPDSNPYLVMFALVQAGIRGVRASASELSQMRKTLKTRRTKKLWGTIHEALKAFEGSAFMKEILGKTEHAKYAVLKTEAAERSPLALGSQIKRTEVIHHHEVTNQILWSDF